MTEDTLMTDDVALPSLPRNHLALFRRHAVRDALHDLAALAQCLCDHPHEHYGVTVLSRIIRDSLVHLSERDLSPATSRD